MNINGYGSVLALLGTLLPLLPAQLIAQPQSQTTLAPEYVPTPEDRELMRHAKELEAVPESDEALDKKAQAEMLEIVKDSAIVPYHPDPDLSKKVAPLQKEYDEAFYKSSCQTSWPPEGLPLSIYKEAYERNMNNSKLTKVYNDLLRVFPDGRDHKIAWDHLRRVHDRLYGTDSDYCERNKARFSAAVTVTWVIGCPNLEAVESVVSMLKFHGEKDAIQEASKNQCVNIKPDKQVFVEETKLYNGYPVTRIRPEGGSSSYWTADPDAFRNLDPLRKVNNLECVVDKASSFDTRDPISGISIKVTLDNNLNVEEFTAVHHATSGANYNRADQYPGARLSQVPGHVDYTWTGVLARNPSKTMKGRLVRSVDQRWLYYEQLFDHGRLDYSMESLCHAQ
jgi:hypothetical protein